MKVLFLLALVVALAVIYAFPLNFVLMLSLGNFGYPQYGFWDCLPLAWLISMAFTLASSNNKS